MPTAVKIDANGNLVVADDGGSVWNVSWNDDSVLNQTSGGPGMEPDDVALDAGGNLYVAGYNSVIRELRESSNSTLNTNT